MRNKKTIEEWQKRIKHKIIVDEYFAKCGRRSFVLLCNKCGAESKAPVSITALKRACKYCNSKGE